MNSNLHILLVDDDPDDRMLFREALRETYPDIKLTLTEGCDMLMKKLEELDKPDLILLDLNMPGINGFECMDEIKKNKEFFEGIPVIIYSTSANPEQVKIIYDKGASLYLQKPTSFEGIKLLMKKVLSLNLKEYFRKARERHIVFRA